MKKKILILLAFTALFPLSLFSVPDGKVAYPEGKSYIYRVTFTDKQGTPYSVDRPEEFLSPKALERRRRQGLSVDSTDLPLSPDYIRRVADMGVGIVGMSKWNNTLLAKSSDLPLLLRIQQLPCVKRIHKVWESPDSVDSNAGKREERKEGFFRWDSIRGSHYGKAEKQIEMIGGVKLHEAGFRGQGMTVAVIDGGFNNSDSLACFSNINILGHKDFIGSWHHDMFCGTEHGTSVLSTMAMNSPEVFVGTAPEASYWLLRSEDVSTESLVEEDYWAGAAEFADSVGADVINSSLGYQKFDNKEDSHWYDDLNGETTLISHTASMIASKGMILCCSAGNEGVHTWKMLTVPADARDVITVGAVSENKVNAIFSSMGPTADGRVKPDVMALGSPAQVVSAAGSVWGSYGTSYSSPIVCGMVTCLWQALPEKTAVEIIELVRKSGSLSHSPNPVYGYGIPDFWNAYCSGKEGGDD